MTIVTCAALAAAIAGAVPGDVFELEPGSNCPGIVIRDRDWSRGPVTLVLDGAILNGLELEQVKGFRVRGGNLRAPRGPVIGPGSSALLLRRVSNVWAQNILFTNASRGVVIADSSSVRVRFNNMDRLRIDGMVVARSSNLRIEGNRMQDFTPQQTRCTYPDGGVTERISRATCEGAGGSWADGDHPDGVQIYESVSNVQILGNTLSGDMQGLGRMGPLGNGISRIVVERNRLNVSRANGITFVDCMNCRIVGNEVRSNGEGQFRTIIRYGGSTGAFCGNVSPDMDQQDPAVRPCPVL